MRKEIHNEALSVTIDTHGAEAVSVKNMQGEEMLWQGDPDIWGRHAPILFPWTGKLPGGTFSYEGKTYKGGQHGFARDVEHTVVSQQTDEIILELKADDDTLKRFPFFFTLRSIFKLDGNTLHHTLEVENNDKRSMPFGIGYHPAFNVPFDDLHQTEDYEFRFEREESPLIIDARPNGLLSGKNYYRWKNTETIQLTDDLFLNDSFCMAGLRSKTLGIYEKDTGKNIVCDIEGYPFTLIWSALTGKIHFVCIEPWRSLTGAESDPQDWMQRSSAAVLKPSEVYTTTLTTKFNR